MRRPSLWAPFAPRGSVAGDRRRSTEEPARTSNIPVEADEVAGQMWNAQHLATRRYCRHAEPCVEDVRGAHPPRARRPEGTPLGDLPSLR